MLESAIAQMGERRSSVLLSELGPFIYQKDPKYRKDPEIHSQVIVGRVGRFNLIFKNVLMSIFEYSYNKKNIIYCLVGLVYDTTGPPRGFGDLGRRAIYFQGAGEHC